MSPVDNTPTISKTSDNSIKIISLPDVHLGHDTTTSIEIIAGLEIAVSESDPFLRELDYLLYPGDLFDRLLVLPNQYLPSVRAELRRQLYLAEKYDFEIIILEGTPAHDWKQSKLFIDIAKEIGFTGNIRYVSTLTVETSSKGHTFLFVPDEWRSDNNKTYREAVDAIKMAGLEKVDFIMLHGQFEYQFPDFLGIACHDSKAWQKLVNHYLFCGHIHTPSHYGKIIFSGSFDRLRHNEEHPKGHYRVTIHPDKPDEIVFVVNELAKDYVSIDCAGMTVENIIEAAGAVSSGLRFGSYIRLVGDKSTGLKELLKVIDREYPQYRWSVKATSDKVQSSNAAVVKMPPIKSSFVLDEVTVYPLAIEKMNSLDIGLPQQHRITALLSKLIDERRK